MRLDCLRAYGIWHEASSPRRKQRGLMKKTTTCFMTVVGLMAVWLVYCISGERIGATWRLNYSLLLYDRDPGGNTRIGPFEHT